jgi:hypothetical protein
MGAMDEDVELPFDLTEADRRASELFATLSELECRLDGCQNDHSDRECTSREGQRSARISIRRLKNRA